MTYAFQELVELDRIKALMQAFYELTGFPSAILDVDGNILEASDGSILRVGWKRICVQYHRVHPETVLHCHKSDTELSRVLEGKSYASYRCMNGLVDVAIPVVIDGDHLVNLFTGQFFLERPDRDWFDKRAAIYGFNKDDYLEALDEVPVFNQDFVDRCLAFLEMLAKIIADMGLKQKKLLEELDRSKAMTQQAHKAQQEAIRARELAETAVEVRSRFFAAASHDLRQPLQALRLFIDLLTDRLAGTDHDRVIAGARAGLASAEGILTALFDVARLQTGVTTPKPAPVHLGDLLGRLASEFSQQAHTKGLSFRVRALPQSVVTDEAMLERILRNLIGNALRYTERGGILVACRARPTPVIEVWDTGRGIPEGHLEKIWEEFYQVGNPARDRAEGLGLGLSIARKLAETLGHDLDVRSRPGVGTVFRLHLTDIAAPI